ncbi:MAG TPA: hypothetical protein VOA41_00885 [Candidatus Dormibacteraeota bacterium]|nr:hypothetical protein [Candidatus Dormibacteraeota bacterium]
MKTSHGILELAAICLIIVILSIVGVIADFLAHIALNIDGLLLLATCLMMGGLFTLMLFLIARDQGWIPRREKNVSPAPADAKK